MWGNAISTLTFTSACGGSGTADDGVTWIVTSNGKESQYEATKGIHYGTSSAEVQCITLSTSGIIGTISKVFLFGIDQILSILIFLVSLIFSAIFTPTSISNLLRKLRTYYYTTTSELFQVSFRLNI